MKLILTIDDKTNAITTIEVTDAEIPEETGSMHTLYCDCDAEKERIPEMSVQDMIKEYTDWHRANQTM